MLIDTADILTSGDVLELAGVTRMTLKRWRDRKRDPFPQPFQRHEGGRIALYDRRTVTDWLERNTR